jgi:short-subunit dehydrogenase
MTGWVLALNSFYLMTFPNQKRALITGASSGIGQATALAFAKAGINLALVSRSPEKLQEVAQSAQQAGVKAAIYPLDLANLESVRDGISAIVAQEGIDILVNNAGIGYTGTTLETPLSDWQQVMDLNLTSVFQCIQGVLPTMRQMQSGTIINIASIAAYQHFPGWCAYNVSKAALVALSKTLASEERGNGIRVTVVSPGAVNTPIWDTPTMQADFDRSKMLTPEMVAQSILYTAMLPQAATVEELTITPSGGSF